MSWEYHSRETALKFSQMDRSIPKDAVKKIIEELRSKKKTERREDSKMGGSSQKFDLMLDVGCGSGETINQFRPFFKSVIGIDSSQFQIDEALKLNAAENVTYIVGSGEAMPVSDKSVDIAVFIFSVFYMDVNRVEQELDRVLKPDGLAVFYSYYIDGIDLVPSAFPDLAPEICCLWNNCLKVFEDYAVQTDHPTRHYLSRYKEIYEGLGVMNKRMIDLKSSEYSNLEEFLFTFSQAIPFYRNGIKALGFNPVEEFRGNLKRLWNIQNVDDKDVNLKLTLSSLMILLERK